MNRAIGNREMDGQAREGNGRAERERTSQILMRTDAASGQTYYYQDGVGERSALLGMSQQYGGSVRVRRASDTREAGHREESRHEGSVTQLTDASGAVIESYRYDAFGAVTIKDGSGNVISATAYNNRFLFTGREYIQQFGIYEYRARTYHPGLGRFLSEDPKGFDAGDYNLFRYCDNDPEDLTDPMGLNPVAPPTTPVGEGENPDPPRRRLKPGPFTSQILEGPGTQGAPMAAKNPGKFKGGFSRGEAYGPNERIDIAPFPGAGDRGLIRLTQDQIDATLAATKIAAERTAEGPEAAVGVTVDKNNRVSLTRHYAYGMDSTAEYGGSWSSATRTRRWRSFHRERTWPPRW